MSKKKLCKCCKKEKLIHARGLCSKCYQSCLSDGTIENYKSKTKRELKKCKVDGCCNYSRADGYCHRHYSQIRRNGIIYGNPNRTKLDKNEIIIEEDYAKLTLYDSSGNKKEEYGIIDIDDVDRVKEIKWCRYGKYIANSKVSLHRFIMNCNDSNLVVDHINHNPLDNRKCNLRICTSQENGYNKTVNDGCRVGVSKMENNKYKAYICIYNNVLYLGMYDNIEDAIIEKIKSRSLLF